MPFLCYGLLLNQFNLSRVNQVFYLKFSILKECNAAVQGREGAKNCPKLAAVTMKQLVLKGPGLIMMVLHLTVPLYNCGSYYVNTGPEINVELCNAPYVHEA